MFKRLQTLCLLAILSAGNAANAQYVFTCLDINPGAGHSIPLELTSCNNKLYCQANDGTNGVEPWISDGTLAGTKILKDINPGGSGSDPVFFVELNGKTFFSASDGTNGKELWISDGTAAGTQLLKDINPGAGSSNPYRLAVSNGKLYFQANDGTHGEEAWVSDGTPAGTQLLKDINNGAANSKPGGFFGYNGQTFFSANNGTDGEELWISDGTTAGTKMLKDINAGAAPGVSIPYYGEYFFAAYNGKLYFPARDMSHGIELWETDGTTAGTQIAVDYYPILTGLEPQNLTVYNGKLYFSGLDTGVAVNNRELFVTDGTPAGTKMVKDIYPGLMGASPGSFIEYQNKLFFWATEPATSTELWVTDGTEAGTALFKDIYVGGGVNSSSPGGFVLYSDKLFFTAHRGDGREVFVSDGTAAGTFDIRPASANKLHPLGGNIEKYTVAANSIFYSAWYNDSTGTELWVLRDTTLTDTATSVNNVKPSPVFYTLAPNPANDVLQVTLNSSHADGHISITDMTGRRLFEKTVTTGEKIHTISTTDMPASTYIFSYTALGTTTTKKFVIQR